jgi:very-long-chain (3R)-3-hydroxyacyl-CoA dehydratase
MAPDAPKPAKRSSPVKTTYLILYNAISAILWATVLGRTVATNLESGPAAVHSTTGDFVLWTQTLMILDVFHALFGMCPSSTLPRKRVPLNGPASRSVALQLRSLTQLALPSGIIRSDPVTAAAQVASRYVAVWAVQYPFPELCQSPIYSSMLGAWSLTEVIRYSYLALKLVGWEPYAFLWVRYSSYLILYPVGILSEMGMMYLALGPAKQQIGQLYQLALGACLFVIWPAGAYILVSHMNRQRRKVLRAAKAQDVKATQ